jgi:hypothetical protein
MAEELLAMPKLRLTLNADNDILITRTKDSIEQNFHKKKIKGEMRRPAQPHNSTTFGRLKTFIYTIKRAELSYRSGSKILTRYFHDLEKKFTEIKDDAKILKPDSVINTYLYLEHQNYQKIIISGLLDL